MFWKNVDLGAHTLEKHFDSQHTKPEFDRETFAHTMRLRGIETGANGARNAEGFRIQKRFSRFSYS